MIYAQPGQEGSVVSFKSRYENYIGGEWVAPVKGQYFDNITPVTGAVFCEVPRSTAEDIDLALDAAHKAAPAWGKTSPTERSNILLKIADRIEANLEKLAVAETWDNGKAVRETLNADIPLAADHFRYFAGCIRAQEGHMGEIDHNTVAYHFHEPLGVVGQIIPWNFPLLMAAWKLGPCLAAGGDLLPPGVLNIVNGYGPEAGQALATSKRIAKIAFTGSTPVGSHILKCAAENIIPSTVELGTRAKSAPARHGRWFRKICSKSSCRKWLSAPRPSSVATRWIPTFRLVLRRPRNSSTKSCRTWKLVVRKARLC